MKGFFRLLSVLIAFASCKGNMQPSKVLTSTIESKHDIIDTAVTKADTAILFSGNSAVNLLSFDDNGLLNISHENISLNLTEAETGYDLSVKKLDQTVFSKKQVKGISKVLHFDDWLLFSFYNFLSEDGANEGQAVIINLNKGTAKIFNHVLHNTCNPVVIDNKIYLIDDLNVIEADLNFKINRTLPISYSLSEDPYSYLDTYRICGLSLKHDENLLSIEFTPAKSNIICKFFSGKIADNDTVIILKEY